MNHGTPRGWPANFQWDCRYVQGRCLKALGNTTDGQPLVAGAIAKKSYLAQLYDLHEPPAPTP